MPTAPQARPTPNLDRGVLGATAAGGAVLVVDQVTKSVFDSWECGDIICPLRNEELMLGVVGGTDLAVLAWTFVGLALFFWWLRAARRRAAIPALAVALVVSGMVGNLIDRLLLGSVRDFLAFPGNAVINVADVALVAGMVWSLATVAAALLRSAARGD